MTFNRAADQNGREREREISSLFIQCDSQILRVSETQQTGSDLLLV